MPPIAFVPLLGREFDGFLYAPIGEEKNEMMLSVISALARMDVDPWREGAALRDLPKELATRRLAALLEKLPAGRSGKFDEWTVASRLIALLPPAGAGATLGSPESPEFGSIRDPQLAMLMFFALSMLVALSVTAYRQPQSVPNSDPATISNSSSSTTPLSGLPGNISSADMTLQRAATTTR